MIEELAETIVPGGAFVAVGVALGATFGEHLRPLAKRAIKAGMAAAEQVQGVAAEAYERGQDLVAEARQEYEQENGRPGEVKPTSAESSEASEGDRPGRRRPSPSSSGVES